MQIHQKLYTSREFYWLYLDIVGNVGDLNKGEDIREKRSSVYMVTSLYYLEYDKVNKRQLSMFCARAVRYNNQNRLRLFDTIYITQ